MPGTRARDGEEWHMFKHIKEWGNVCQRRFPCGDRA